jgi:hypothetical protein
MVNQQLRSGYEVLVCHLLSVICHSRVAAYGFCAGMILWRSGNAGHPSIVDSWFFLIRYQTAAATTSDISLAFQFTSRSLFNSLFTRDSSPSRQALLPQLGLRLLEAGVRPGVSQGGQA